MRSGSLTRPSPLDAFDCGSQSMSRVLTSAAAKDEARLIAVVVFPTPPFWLATAMTRPIKFFRRTGAVRSIVRIDCDLQRRNLVQGALLRLRLHDNQLANISEPISTARTFHVDHNVHSAKHRGGGKSYLNEG